MVESSYQIPAILELYPFEQPSLPDRFKCILCQSILKNAHQTSCGCLCCEKCIKSYLANGPKPCPSKDIECKDVVLYKELDIKQDNAINKEIINLEVNCPFELCSLKLTFGCMVEHLFYFCRFREISCDKCTIKFQAKDKDKHEKNECEMRNVRCKYCSKEMSNKDLKSIHLNSDSDNFCTKYSTRKLKCPFHDLDCNLDEMTKESIVKHLQAEYISNRLALISTIEFLERINNDMQAELEDRNWLGNISPVMFNRFGKSQRPNCRRSSLPM